MNAHIESFNRTIQEYFVDFHEYELLDLKKFNNSLIDWLLWYNGKRGHCAFKNKLSPLEFMVSLNEANKLNLSLESRMRWTYAYA